MSCVLRMHVEFMDGAAYAVEYIHGIALIEYANITQSDAQPLLSLLWWLGSLEFLGTTELYKLIRGDGKYVKDRRTFLARFLRSFRSLRVGLSFLVSNLD